MTVEFASGPAEVKGKALADLLHGWAITVHRAQGSEFPAVVVVLPPEAGGMLSRPLVYTALTRAQRHLSVVHAAGPAVARAVRQVGALPRRTRLIPLLREVRPMTLDAAQLNPRYGGGVGNESVKVAVVQRPPVLLDRDATVKVVVDAIDEVAEAGRGWPCSRRRSSRAIRRGSGTCARARTTS